ncbi:MAG: PQQ-binding-like beta-propeller repeat protein [Chitinophagaceae bacterium]
MKTMFNTLWLIVILLAIASCKKTKNEEIITPSDNNKLVIVNDVSGTVYGINAQTGTPVWKAENPGGSPGNYISSPGVTADAVLFADMGNSRLRTYNTVTGVLSWSKNYIYSSYYASPLVENNMVYVANNEKVTGYIIESGAAVKEFNVPYYYTANSINKTNNMFIVATCGGHLFGVNTDGIKQWEYQSNIGCYHNNPAINKGTIYILTSNGILSAVNAATGAELWKRDEGAYAQNAAVVYYDGMLFVTGNGNKAYAFEAYDGDLVHTYTLPDNEYIYNYAAPAVYDGKLYLISNEATVVAFDINGESIAMQKKLDMPGGRMAGRISFDNRTETVYSISSVVIANNTLFVSAGKAVYALSMKGDVKWSFTAQDYIFNSPVVLTDFNKTYRSGNAGIVE